MATENINWNYWRTFLVVLETGSLSGAARKLAYTQPTVGRHIDILEQSLAAPLFIRSQEGLMPTPFAQTLKARVQAMSMSAHALSRIANANAEDCAGVVRISASEIVGVEILPEILQRFREKHPKVSLELVLSNLQGNLLNHDVDIALRMVRPTQQRLLAKKIGKVSIGLYASKSYFQNHEMPSILSELMDHHLIGFDRDAERWRNVKIGDHEITSNDLSFRCDSDIGQLAGLRSGLGIGACQSFVAQRDPSLIGVLSDQFSFDLEMWVVMHEDLKANRITRAVFEHCVEQLPKFINTMNH